MKKSIIYFFFLSLLFIACSDSSNDDNSTNDDQGQEVPTNPIAENPDNFQETGDSANDILSNSNFNALRVEIAFADGFRPTQAAMDGFEEFLQFHSFKENVELVFTELPSSDQEDFSLQEIADLELENRTVYNEGNTLGVYIYFADAPSEEDELEEGLVTLGAVYRNTSMVIYEQTIRALSNNIITDADIESATLNHEFGHLMGLVNLGTVAINDHEDTTTDDDGNVIGNNHCNVPGCLMLAELSFNLSNNSSLNAAAFNNDNSVQSACSLNGLQLIKQLQTNAALGLDIVPDLDPECQLDLGGNGGPNTLNL